MGRSKDVNPNLPANMTLDSQRQRWRIRNPETRKRKWFKFSDKQLALDTATALNEYLHQRYTMRAIEYGRPSVGAIVERWIVEQRPFMPWGEATAADRMAKMHAIVRTFGTRSIIDIGSVEIQEHLASFCRTADTFNKWRYVFCLVWEFAVAKQLVDVNQPAKISERSNSKKIDANKKQRKPLTLDAFWSIRDHTDTGEWLKLAMDISLVTLQGRSEVCDMEHAHFRDGHLFIIRDKTSDDSDKAFIKVALTPELLSFQKRALWLDGIKSPFLVHRKPDRARRDWLETKTHFTYVNPQYLSKAFAEARDASGVVDHLPANERPSFHEIRGLGSREQEKRGMSINQIRDLMTHAKKSTTKIYLDGGAEALTDADYVPVIAPLTLAAFKVPAAGSDPVQG